VRLLLVEDDDIVADAILRGLTAASYSVHRVSSAESAQAALLHEEFALAIIDVGLPAPMDSRWCAACAAPGKCCRH